MSVNRGVDWSVDGGGGSYRYLPEPRLVALRRTSGPTTGATYLTVYGVNFVDTGALACHFGHHPSHTMSASATDTGADTGADTGGDTGGHGPRDLDLEPRAHVHDAALPPWRGAR